MLTKFDIEAVLLTCWVDIANLLNSDRFSDLQFIGHSHSGCYKKYGPFCQLLFSPISVGCSPLVQSAVFHLLLAQVQSSGQVQVGISPV